MEWNLRRLGGHICIVLICLLLIEAGTVFGQTLTDPGESKKEAARAKNDPSPRIGPFADPDIELTLTTGLRVDDLDWSIAGNGTNVLSELTWSDVESYQIAMAGRIQLDNNVYGRGAVNYAWIEDGTIRDSDYGQDNRTAEWSRSISDSTGDEVWDVTAGGGYSYHFVQDTLTVTPLIGLSYHRQNLRIQNGNQTLSNPNPFPGDNPPPVGPLSSQLNSTYFARWFGPWIGCDLRYKPKMQPSSKHAMEFRFSLELHWADYYGEGNWNLRSAFQHPRSFEHEADGFGICVSAQWLINLYDRWDLTVATSYQDWTTEAGTDRKFLAAGGTSTTRLNEVNWESTSFMLGAVYHF